MNLSTEQIDSILAKCKTAKYSNSLKYLINIIPDETVKMQLITRISYYNPFLAAQILSSICSDTQNIERKVMEIIKKGMTFENGFYKKELLLKASIHMKNYPLFVDYYISILADKDIATKKSLNNRLCREFNADDFISLYEIFLSKNSTRFIKTSLRAFSDVYQIYDSRTKQLVQTMYEKQEYELLCSFYKSCDISLIDKLCLSPKEYNDILFIKKCTSVWTLLDEFKFIYGISFYDYYKKSANDLAEIVTSFSPFCYHKILRAFSTLAKHTLLDYDTIAAVLEIINISNPPSPSQKINNRAKVGEELRLLLQKPIKSLRLSLIYDFPYDENEALQFLNEENAPKLFSYSCNIITRDNDSIYKDFPEINAFMSSVFSKYHSFDNIITVYLNSPLRFIVTLHTLIDTVKHYRRFTIEEINHGLSLFFYSGRYQILRNTEGDMIPAIFATAYLSNTPIFISDCFYDIISEESQEVLLKGKSLEGKMIYFKMKYNENTQDFENTYITFKKGDFL